MKKLFYTVLMALVVTFAFAQKPQVMLYGYLEEGYFESNMPKKVKEGQSEILQSVQVKVILDGQEVHSIMCRHTGFYAVLLEEGKTYDVLFEKEGYLTRKLELNTAGVELPNDEATLKCLADISLFKVVDNKEVALFIKEPYAKCVYDKNKKEMVWDMAYTENVKHKFAQMAEPVHSAMPKR
jgi:hypothetical protein